MKVLLVNGSPNEKGCTYTALQEVARTLEKEGIETEFFWIGKKAVSGCIAPAINAVKSGAASLRMWSMNSGKRP